MASVLYVPLYNEIRNLWSENPQTSLPRMELTHFFMLSVQWPFRHTTTLNVMYQQLN